MGVGRPEDDAEVVRRAHPFAVAWVVATREPCLTIQKDEVQRVARVLVAASPAQLPSPQDLPGCWLMAVLLCPGDDAGLVAARATGLPEDERLLVRFYHHPGVDLVAALAPWYARDLPDPYTTEVSDFKTFHKQFGLAFNDAVYAHEARRPVSP